MIKSLKAHIIKLLCCQTSQTVQRDSDEGSRLVRVFHGSEWGNILDHFIQFSQ